MARSISIRQSLLRNLVMVILVLAGGILAVTVAGVRTTVRALSGSLITSALEQAEWRLQGFFYPIVDDLAIARRWGEDGLLEPTDPASVDRLFLPLMKQFPQVSSVMVADERGRETLLLRSDAGWTSRETRADEWGAETRWREWTDDGAEPVVTTRTVEYDPRDRPWFRGAVGKLDAAGGADARPDPASIVHWTAPYQFFTTKEPGITASVAWTGPEGVRHVVGFDLRLRDISDFTRRLAITPGAKVIVLSEDITVIGLPADPRFDDPAAQRAALLRPPDEIGLLVAADATAAFGVDRPPGDAPIRFESGGRWWWGHTRPFALAFDRWLWAAVVVPESDLLGDLTILRLWILAITLAVLAATVARAVVLARRYSRPIESLVSESDRIRRGDLEPGAPIDTPIREVRRLAAAHDRMRDGLRSLLKLERDLELARQIQQNTFPSVLPALPGYELVAWSEPAEETGGDTYDVIGVSAGETGGRARAHAHARAGEPAPSHPGGAVLLLADATGHGIGPALSVAQLRAMLRMAVQLHADLPTIARRINTQLVADLPSGRFITAWLGDLDPGAHTLASFSAGQGPLLRYIAAEGVIEVGDADTMPFGVAEDLPITAPVTVRMEPGDIFAVISDGIFEAMDPDNGQFGLDRVREIIVANHGRTPEEILATLCAAVDEFARGRPADDDRTVILLKRV